MKKNVIAILFATALLLTACTESSKVTETGKDKKEQVTTEVTEAETTTEAAGSETAAAVNNVALNMSFDEVKDALIDAYAKSNEANEFLANLKENDMVVPPADINAPLGIKKAVICACGSFGGEVIYIQFLLFEMDMDSDAYRSLKVGDKIEFYLTDDSDYLSSEYVIAINGQYVLTAYESYKDGDEYHTQPPYNYKGLNYVLEEFTKLK